MWISVCDGYVNDSPVWILVHVYSAEVFMNVMLWFGRVIWSGFSLSMYAVSLMKVACLDLVHGSTTDMNLDLCNMCVQFMLVVCSIGLCLLQHVWYYGFVGLFLIDIAGLLVELKYDSKMFWLRHCIHSCYDLGLDMFVWYAWHFMVSFAAWSCGARSMVVE